MMSQFTKVNSSLFWRQTTWRCEDAEEFKAAHQKQLKEQTRAAGANTTSEECGYDRLRSERKEWSDCGDKDDEKQSFSKTLAITTTRLAAALRRRTKKPNKADRVNLGWRAHTSSTRGPGARLPRSREPPWRRPAQMKRARRARHLEPAPTERSRRRRTERPPRGATGHR